MSEIRECFDTKEKERYETLLRRIGYDDRDFIMYQDMLDFLWPYIIGDKWTSDLKLICEEYSHWNMQMIEKVLYHDHDIPYANIRRCYQTIVELIRHDPEAGRKQLEDIGTESFSYDGIAPKVRMDARGRVFRPMSKLFLIYNFAKYYQKHGMEGELKQLKDTYPYAFKRFDDEEHRSHDQFLSEQMEDLSDRLIYPIDEKVYKIPWGPRDFFLFYDENSFISF